MAGNERLQGVCRVLNLGLISGAFAGVFALACSAPSPAFDQVAAISSPLSTVSVLQNRYDKKATGANLQETILTTSNVTSAKFGRLFSYPVQGNIVAQPLYLPQKTIAGQGVHNLLFVATSRDWLYCFDGDSNQGSAGGRLWQKNFAPSSSITTFPPFDATGVASEHLDNHLGILSTPIIDPATNTLYVVVNTKEATQKKTRLHALDALSGNERSGSPVEIAATYTASDGRVLSFDTQVQMQRPGLAMSGNNVILAFSSHDDVLPDYQGWVIEYDKTSLQRTGAFATITTGGAYGGGIWMAGRPPVVDDQGFVYVFTGNGFGPTAFNGSSNFSESALKLNPQQGLSLVDYFTPYNWAELDGADEDLASSGPMLIPGTSLLAGGGKEGVLYILDTAHLGHNSAASLGANPQIVQEQRIVPEEHIMSGPVFWPRTAAAGGSLLFNSGESDSLKAWPFDGTRISSSPVAASEINQGHPGAITALSANGQQAGSGIVWTYARAPANGAVYGVAEIMPGILRAYDAGNVSHLLWTSQQNFARDDSGLFGKFSVPTVVNGMVYLGTNSNQVVAYGLLPTSPSFTLKAYPPRALALGGKANYTISPFKLNGYGEALSYTVSAGLPTGATASFSSAAADGSVTLSITTSASTPKGLFALTVRAAGSTQNKLQDVLLEVDGSVSVPFAQRSIRAVDSEEPLANNQAANVIDRNNATAWVTQWVNASPAQGHWVDLDLGAVYNLTGLSYLPRQDACANGNVRRFQGYVSLDAITWGPVVADGSFDYGTSPLDCSGTGPNRYRQQNVGFREPKPGRFVRFLSTLEVNFGPWTSAAEIDVFTNGVAAGAIPSSATQVSTIRGSDGTCWVKSYQGGWSHWDTLQGGLAADPVSVGSASSTDILIQGTNGELWTSALNSGTFSGWSSLVSPPSGVITSRPAAVKNSAARLDVIVRGSDTQVWNRTRTNGNWGAWTSAGGNILGDPSLLLLADGSEIALARGTNAGIWYNVKASTAWAGWVPLAARDFSSQPSAVLLSSGRIDVFAIGTDRAVYTLSRVNSSWGSTWLSLGPDVIGGYVTPVVESSSDVSVFALGANDSTLWTQRRTASNWSGWSQVGTYWSYTAGPPPAFGSAPRAVLDADGQLQLTVPAGGQIYQNRRIKNRWGIWVPAN